MFAASMLALDKLDWFVIGLYVAVIGLIGFFLVRKARSAEGYFLAGRSLTWPFIGASLFAANISTEHLVGLAGSGYGSGMGVGAFEWTAVYCLVPLIVLFLPFYVRNQIFTVPEFLERRFSPAVRYFFSGYMVVLSVLAKISVSLWGVGLMFEQLLGWNMYAVIWGIGLFTALYTMKGGLKVVVYTDALQTIVLMVAAVVLVTVGLQHVGGWSELRETVPRGFLEVVKPAIHRDYPWPGIFIGVIIVGCFYWAMDQVIVQRAFAARDLTEGRLGAVFGGFLKLTTPFLLVLPGLIALVLVQKGELPWLEKNDHAYPNLLKELMPHGLLGLTVAGFSAALMGHLSATYNSIATLFTRDFYLTWRPNTSPQRQVFVGRVAVLVVFLLGALWAPMIGRLGEDLFTYLQIVQAYLMMPFAGIFFLGVLWRRSTTQGVIACLAAACVVCPLLMANWAYQHRTDPVAVARVEAETQQEVEAVLLPPQVAHLKQSALDASESGWIKTAKQLNQLDLSAEQRVKIQDVVRSAQTKLQDLPGFLPLMDHPLLRPWLHSALVAFLICMAVLVVVSLLTKPTSAEKLATTTVTDWRALLSPGQVPLYRNYLVWMTIMLAAVTALFIAFR